MERIFIIQNTPIGENLPLSVYLTGLLENLSNNKKFEINLIAGKIKNFTKNLKKNINKYYEIEGSTYSIIDNLKFVFKSFCILIKENKLKKINILHCFYPNSSLMAAVLFKVLNSNVELIYDIRSPWIEMSIQRGHVKKFKFLYKIILYLIEKFLCKFVDKFMFISEGTMDYYKKKFIKLNNKKFFISPSGVDTKFFRYKKSNLRNKLKIKKNEILIGYIGSVDKIRQLDKFFYIFKELNKNYKLLIVGSGDDEKNLKKLAVKLNLKNRIIFYGKVNHKEAPKIISIFDFGLCYLPDIFIFQNSSPIKILEYISCGIPVLASNLKSHIELSKRLKNIYIFNNSKDIENIIKIHRNKKIRDSNIKFYSWAYLTQNYYKMWEERYNN